MQDAEGFQRLSEELAQRTVGELSYDELLEVVEQLGGGGISLGFAGKTATRRLARRVRPRVMRRVAKYGIGTDEQRSRNRLIEGDNLQAMTTLYKERGKIDLILTDPPYNTGNDFRYNDKWDTDPNDPGLGDWVRSEDGARRTKWMKFMWPRLAMMKAMLKPGGVLAICIDHRELFRLGQMLDELFGEQNRLAIINWQKAASLRNDKEGVSRSTEYVLVYARDQSRAVTGRLARTEDQDRNYANPDNDPEGPWTGVSPFAPGAKTHPGMVYAVQHPFTGELIYPSGDQCWKKQRKTIKSWFEMWGSTYQSVALDDGCGPALLLEGARDPRELATEPDPVVTAAAERAREVMERGGALPPMIFTKKGLGLPRLKTYLNNLKSGVIPSTYWSEDDMYQEPLDLGSTAWASPASGTSEAGSRELGRIVGTGHGFETVKPLKLFTKIIQVWCPPGGTVLDPFAGSGTTGHAVLNSNQALEVQRRFILIEQGRPERGDPYATALTADRLQKVITGEWASGDMPPLTGGFEFLRLGRKVDAAALLKMEREEMCDTVIESHFDATRRRGAQLTRCDDGYRYLVAHNSDNEGFFLVWDGPTANTDITEDVYELIVAEGAAAGLSPTTYHVYARLWIYQTDDVRFLQIPDRILADFGLDARSEPFGETEAAGDDS